MLIEALVDSTITTLRSIASPESVTTSAGTKEAYVLEASQEQDNQQPGRVVSRRFKLNLFYLPTIGERLTVRGAVVAIKTVEPVYAEGIFKMATVEAEG